MTCISTQVKMKISSDLIKEYEQQESGGSSKDDYLNYSQLEHKQNIEFALLEADPFEYWMVWGDPVGEGKKKPFRFLENPTSEDIDAELGANYTQGMAFQSLTEKQPPARCLTWPVYNWTDKKVQVLEVSHKSVINQFLKYGLNKKYARNILSWDFEITKIVSDRTRYELMIVPRDEDDHDEEAMDAAWNAVTKKGFDLKKLITGGDPFSEG